MYPSPPRHARSSTVEVPLLAAALPEPTMSYLLGQMAPSLDASAEVEIEPILAPKPVFVYLFLESMEVKDQPMQMRGVADSYLYMDTLWSLAIWSRNPLYDFLLSN